MLEIGAATIVEQLELAATNQLQALFEAALQTADECICTAAPEWLGHCKLMLDTGDQVCYVSRTEANGHNSWSNAPKPLATATKAEITIYIAVYGIDDRHAQLAAQAAQTMLKQLM
ncbi:hypothetical protein [Herpetosiphon sp. NSE202]|uniref:hypothetical protein n=1 Tax=Herpetosiphon sp. NSE202 TaxID=3351349 RepID=UPI003644F015